MHTDVFDVMSQHHLMEDLSAGESDESVVSNNKLWVYTCHRIPELVGEG